MNGDLHHAKKLCRFCRTTDDKKHYVSGNPSNFWVPMICEGCVDAATKALAQIRRNQA